MNDRNDMWAAVATLVTARMAAAVMSQADLVRASGLSDPLVRGIMCGNPRGEPRPVNLAKASTALGWSADSIARILEGGEPELVVSQPSDVDADVLRRLKALEQAVSAVMASAADREELRSETVASAMESLGLRLEEIERTLLAAQ